MRIQLDYSPDLDTKELHDYILDPTDMKTFEGPKPNEAGYTIIDNTKSGSKTLPFFSSVKEYYNVLKRNTLVGNFDILVPIKQSITLDIFMNLLVKDAITEELKLAIQRAFKKYDPAVDPLDYAQANLGEDITPDMFMVLPSFTITKIGPPEEMKEQKETVLAMYQQADVTNSTMDIVNKDTKLGTYFRDKGLKAVWIKTEKAGYIPAPPEDELHEKEVKDNSDTEIINEILNEDTKGLDCKIYDVERIEKRIATILLFPEFKIEWHQISFEVGCVRITIPFPVLYMRISSKVLYAYVGRPQNVDHIFITQLENCAIKAAIAGAVIGIVLGNFGGAIIAFKAVFTECIEYNAGQYAQCLVPGLALLSENVNDWTTVL